MLSNDELNNGTSFTLKLWDAAGVATEWCETLSGDVARRWYDIYRRSDWEALRREGPAMFRHRGGGTLVRSGVGVCRVAREQEKAGG